MADGCGKSYNIVDSHLVSQFPDQFKPFAALRVGFNAQERKMFDGTIFRLPLRSPVQLENSAFIKFHPNLAQFSKDAILTEFNIAKGLGGRLIAFSKFLSGLSLYRTSAIDSEDPEDRTSGTATQSTELNEEGNTSIRIPLPDTESRETVNAIQSTIMLNYKLSLRNRSEALNLQRRAISTISNWKPTISFTGRRYPKEVVVYRLLVDVIDEFRQTTSLDELLVVQSLAGEASIDMSLRKDLKLLGVKPFIGVSACLSSRIDAQCKSTDNHEVSNEDVNDRHGTGNLGRAFSPFPREATGLPIDICGNFISHRQTLSNQNSTSSHWNATLIQDLYKPWAVLVTELIKEQSLQLDPFRLYSFWPTIGTHDPRFDDLAKRFYRKIATKPVFRLGSSGKYGLPKEGYFLTSAVGPSLRSYIGLKIDNCIEITASCMTELVALDDNRGIFQRKLTAELTPSVFRSHVQDTISKKQDLLLYANDNQLDPVELVTQMFEFMAKDLVTSREHQRMLGLLVVPLKSGNIVPCGTVAVLATSNEHQFLDWTGVKIVHPTFSAALMKSAHLLAVAKSINLKPFDTTQLREGMGALVPPSWRGRKQIMWNKEDCSKEKLENVWCYLCPNSKSTEPAQNKQTSESRCDALQDWPLLPLRNDSLLALKARKSVMAPDIFESEIGKNVVDAFEHYGMPVLHKDFCHISPTTEQYQNGQSSIQNQCDALAEKLIDAEKHQLLKKHQDDPERAEVLFRFLVENIDSFAPNFDLRKVLRDLPIYPVFTNHDNYEVRHCSIKSYSFDNVGYPSTFIPQNSDNCLKYDDTYKSLWRFLEVPMLGTAQMFVSQILPTWNHYSNDMRLALLQLLKSRWELLKTEEPQLISQLNCTQCLMNEAGEFVCPTDLIDISGSNLLQSIFQGCITKLPDRSIYGPDWIEFLRDVGVKHHIDEQLFRECCQQAHAEKDATSAELLLRYFKSNVSSLAQGQSGRAFCNWFGSFPIVPTNISDSQPDSAEVPCSFAALRSCSLDRDKMLVSRVRPVVPKDLEPPQVFWTQLGLQSPPTPDMVFDNIESFSNEVLENWNEPVTIEETFCSIFTYLAERVERLHETEIIKLKSIAIIPIAHQMYPVRQVFLKCQENLAPFIFELPRAYYAYEQLFRVVGLKDQPGQTILLDTLQNLHKTFCGNPLNPSELAACVRLLEAIKRDSGRRISTKLKVFVPDTKGCLVPTSGCVFNDASHLLCRISSNASQLQFVSHRVTKAMCDTFGVKSLSEIVTERLTTPTNCETVSCNPLGTQEILSILALLRMYGKNVPYHILSHMETRTRELSTYSIKTSSTLNVSLYDRRLKQIVSGDGSSLSYVDRKGKTIWMATELPHQILLEDVLASAINQIIAPDLPIPLAALLRGSVASIKITRTSMITSKSSRMTNAAILGLSASEDEDFLRGTCGERVLECDLHLLQLKSLRKFHDDEICAVERKDGNLIYAQVIEQVFDDHLSKPSAPKPKPYQMPHYKVQVNHAETCVLVPAQIYSFRHWSVDRDETYESILSDVAHDAVDENVTQDDEGPTKTAIPTVDYLGAVESLLARADLSLSANRQTLMSRVIGLESQNATLIEECKSSAAEVEKAHRAMEEKEQDETCNICFQSLEDGVCVDTALVPCGHVYCKECAARQTGNRCATCKQACRDTLRIFR